MQVGANLFKVFISNDAKEPVVNDSVESKAKSDDNKPSKSTKPSVNSTKELAKQTQGNEYHRVPLIKFLGPRYLVGLISGISRRKPQTIPKALPQLQNL